MTVVAAAWLGPDGFWPWVLAATILAYAPFAALGAVNAMNREVPILLGRNLVFDATRSEDSALWASIASAGVLAVAVTVVAVAYGTGAGFGLALAVAVAFQQVAFCYQAALRSRIRFLDAAVQQLAMAVVFVTVALAGLAWSGVTGLMIAQAAAYGLAVLLGAWVWRRDMRPALDRLLLSKQIVSGLPIALSGLMFALITTQDRWIVSLLGSPSDLGVYGLASTLASGLTLVMFLIGQQLYPRMGFAFGRHDQAAARRLARRQSVIVAMVTGVGAVALTVVASALLSLFMDEYRSAIGPLVVLSLAACVLGAASGYTNLLLVIGRAWRLVGVYATGALVASLTGVVLVASGFGLVGAAAGTFMGSTMVALGAWIQARR